MSQDQEHLDDFSLFFSWRKKLMEKILQWLPIKLVQILATQADVHEYNGLKTFMFGSYFC